MRRTSGFPRAAAVLAIIVSLAGCGRDTSPAPSEAAVLAPGGTVRETTTTRTMDSPQRPAEEPRRVAGEGLGHALSRDQALRDLYTDIEGDGLARPLASLGELAS